MSIHSDMLLNADNIFVLLSGQDGDGDWIAEVGDTADAPESTTIMAHGPTREMALAQLAYALWAVILTLQEERRDR